MTDRMPKRLVRTLVAACVVAVALAGCVGIPTGSGVNAGPVVGADTEPPGADLPDGPTAGATRNEILTDFMQAVVSPENNYGIARLFLAPQIAASWDPTKSVLVREGAPSTQADASGDILYTVTTNASIDDAGIYLEESTQSSQSLAFSFTKVNGQWRISSLADGIVISRTSFPQSFTEVPLYFFDPTFHYLVPDVRWFPTGATLQTRTVSALLGGPSPGLQGGVVVSAFPQGTKQQKAVEVRENTATVALSSDVAAPKQVVRQLMLQQLQDSLASSNITTVAIEAAGAPVQISGPATATVAVAADPAPLILKGKRFGFWPKFTGMTKLAAQVVGLNPEAIAVAHNQSSAAVLAKNGAYLVGTASAGTHLVDGRANLIAPSIDPFGYVWSVPGGDASAIHVTGADGVQHSIASPITGHPKIVSLQVSRDGARALLYLDTTTGPRLVVLGVLRGAKNVPSGFGTPLDLPVSSATPIDATWVDSSSVAILGQTNGQQSVITYTIGGTGGDPSTPVDAVHIVGGSGEAQLRIITSGGQVFQLRPSGWQELNISAAVLATQQ